MRVVVDRDDKETLLENFEFLFPCLDSTASWVGFQPRVEKGTEDVNVGIEGSAPTQNPTI